MSFLPSGGPLWLWLGLAGVFGLTAVFARDEDRREAAYRVLLALLPWARRSTLPPAANAPNTANAADVADVEESAAGEDDGETAAP